MTGFAREGDIVVRRHQRFLSRQHMLTGEYEIYHYRDTGMATVRPHHHDFFECYYFLHGNVTFLIEGKAFDLKPGDIILVNSSELHQAAINDLDEPYERMVLWLDAGFIRQLSSAGTDLGQCFVHKNRSNILRPDLDSQHRVRTLMTQLLELDDANSFGRDLLKNAFLTQLLVLLNQIMLKQGQSQTVEVRKSRRIEAIIDYINENLEKTIQIDDLAEKFYVSKFHLSREFKEQTGATLHRYIVQKKLILAKELILQGKPITDVYQSCGFGDYSNFFRVFRHEYDMTPKQYYQNMITDAPGESGQQNVP